MCGPIQRRHGLTAEQAAKIREWAENNPYIHEVRAFGSRARGRGRIDSDLDVAITAGLGHYNLLDTDWKNELSKRTGLRVGLSHYDTNENVQKACEDFCRLLFRRLPATGGFKRPR